MCLENGNNTMHKVHDARIDHSYKSCTTSGICAKDIRYGARYEQGNRSLVLLSYASLLQTFSTGESVIDSLCEFKKK